MYFAISEPLDFVFVRDTRTESPVARDEHDLLLVDRTAEPVRADVPLRERGERRYVLDADDDDRARSRSGFRVARLPGAVAACGELVQDAREVARSGTDVEHACACGTAAQIWEEELSCVSVLLLFFWEDRDEFGPGCLWCGWGLHEDLERRRTMCGAEMVASWPIDLR